MNKQDIFITASVQDKRVDAAAMEELDASVSVSEVRRLIRDLAAGDSRLSSLMNLSNCV